MSESGDPKNPQGQPPKDHGAILGETRHQPVSARVPERVARGVLSTGVLVLDSPNEFVLDFMQGLTRPFQVSARVVLTPQVMDQFVNAVRDNLAKYEQRFGPPPTVPRPPQDRRPTLQEIYDEFKVPEEMLSGCYCNAVMVGHSPSEFFFDFITNFFPTSAVSARVFVSASQLPRMLEAISASLQRYHQRVAAAQQARSQQQNQSFLQHPHLQQPPQPPMPPEQPPPQPQPPQEPTKPDESPPSS